MIDKVKRILNAFGLENGSSTEPLGNGLINTTYLVKSPDGRQYVMQRINLDIFHDPEPLHDNIAKVTSRLRDVGMPTLHFLPAQSDGKLYYLIDNEAWRVMDYIADSVTTTEVNPRTAFLTCQAIGRFQSALVPVAHTLHDTLPHFHDMEYRLRQFHDAISADVSARVSATGHEIDFLLSYAERMTVPERLARNGSLPRRVCHCDTKVDNMLFDRNGSVICIIDLDTVMPSLVFSDIGDFLRTAASTAPEDEPDTTKIHFRPDIYTASLKGYLDTARFLTDTELELLPTAPLRFAYMQAVRFLTDYLNGDTYYRTAYTGHNLVRARAQIALAKDITERLPQLRHILRAIRGNQ